MRLNPDVTTDRFKSSAQISGLLGQSLVEVVVALGVVVALAVALITASLVTQRSSRTAKNNTQATKLVQQNIEQLRVFRDRKGFSALSDGSCHTLDTTNPDPAQWSLPTCSGADGEVVTLSSIDFARKIAISTPAVNKKQIVVTVQWTDSGGLQSVTNTTFLSNCVGPTVSCD
ncbi:hypothetical protein HYZ70_02815 [Candidatus Curtissbacteria bacterium]|nr:hypothetical protein [Candidatus Curtissbacteria bacterium]